MEQLTVPEPPIERFKVSASEPRCANCASTEGNLLRCSRCSVVHYCNREHQNADFKDHKKDCAAVRKALTKVATEEEKLRNDDDNPFIHGVGVFWSIAETRPYMRDRFAYVQALQKLDTYASVKLQLDTLLDMLRLCRGDNMGVRNLVPGLMLRLNMDQECYDFIKWYSSKLFFTKIGIQANE
jgi:hypothetical protein